MNYLSNTRKTLRLGSLALLAACLVAGLALSSTPAYAQCPAGTGSATFDWSTSAGSGNEWTTANQSAGDSQVYTVNYTDAYGNPNTLDVTVTLQDPDAMNFDDNHVCPAGVGSCDDAGSLGIQTETNGAYGSGFLTVGMASTSSTQTVGLDFTFSKPVTMGDFSVGDIDDVGYASGSPEPWNSYQDVVSFSASLSGSNVPITLAGGSNITVSGQTATAIVVSGVNGGLDPADAAGTVTASSSGFLDTFNFVYSNGPEDATNESGTGASNGHAVRLPGFDTLCVEDTPPALSINKTSSPSGVVLPGETITYTVEVTNNGPGNANNVVVTDTLPTGVTYVGGTAEKTYWVDNVVSDSYTSPNLGPATFEVAGLTQSFDTTGSIPAGATLTSYGFTTTGSTGDWLSDISLTATYPSGTAYTLPVGTFGGNISGSWNETRGPGSFGGPAEGVYQFIWDDVFDNTTVANENSISSVTFTIEYDYISGRIQTTDAAGAPPNLVTAGDGITLEPGETMTVTFDVVVDDPLDPAITELTNTAEATAQGITTPVTDTATNLTESADVAVTKTLVSPGTYEAGETVTYSIVVTNNGPSTATNVVVSDVPSNLAIVSVSSLNCGALPCTIPSLVSGASETITVTATIGAVGLFENVVSVTADQPDPDLTNNDDSVLEMAGNDALACQFDNVAQVTADQDDPNLTNNIDQYGNGGGSCANIEGTVWLDTDGDGINDAGEAGIGGVTVYLCDAAEATCDAGTAIATAVTDANGDYSFPNLPAGDYQIQVEPTELTGGELDGLIESPGNIAGNSGTISLASGETESADFGYVPDTGTSVIEGTVWTDVDGDGIQDPDEIGIPNVTVQLFNPDGTPALDGNGQPITAVTGPDGSYVLTGIPPGEYIVKVDETDPDLAGYSNTTPTSSDPITVLENDIVSDVDFGFNSPTTYEISDAVWYDADGDGVLDPGEEGIAGVTVDLLDSSGNVIATVTTDENGEFNFTGIPDGDYTISVSDNDGVLNGLGETTATGGSSAVTVSGGDVLNAPSDGGTGTFGYNAPGTIGDSIWSDANGDGVQDPEEAGIEGVVVNLLDSGGAVIATTTTGPDGSYEFTGLEPGDYTVQVDSSNFVPGGALEGYTQTYDADGTGTANESDTTLAGAGSDPTQDFGYQNTSLADISGTVFDDLDADGVLEAGDDGIAGVTVDLLDSAGNVIATTTTDTSGNYTFPDLPDGDYTVAVTDTANVLDGYTLTSALDALPVTVAGVDVTDVDFGYAQAPETASIGDTIYFDADRDGIQDAGEGGIDGVTVDLYDAGPDGIVGTADDLLVATTTTDANGNYTFDGLPAGTYYVDVTDTNSELTGLALTAGSDPSGAIYLSEGEDYNEADFGYASATGSALGDTIFYDADGDGWQDPGETGIEGVTVNLIDPGPDGFIGGGDDVVIGTTTTDAQGNYLFTGLTDGKYYVQVDTTQIAALGYDIDPTTGPATRPYEVPVGQDVLYADFGFTGGTPGSIGDTIFLDSDGDGVQDAGEAGISGVTVDLIDPVTGEVLATTVTDDNGNYDFVGLEAGDYEVVVTDLDGVLSDLNLSTPPVGTINLTAGQDYDGADFGYAPSEGTGTIAGTVWHDTNQTADTGILDPDESGFEGVTVELWRDVDGDGIITPGIDDLERTTVTDENGDYAFLGIPYGDYIVNVTDEAGVLDGFQNVLGPTPGADNNGQTDPYPVTLDAASPSDFTADFGYDAVDPHTLSGTAFFDIDGDGTLDAPTEEGVEGVTVSLFRDLDGDGVLDPDEPLIGTTLVSDGTIDVDGDGIVDPVGYYAFTDIPDGDYIVTVDPGGSFVDGLAQTTQTATAPVQPVTIAGADSTDNDFGFTIGTTAVLISEFAAEYAPDGVLVRWQTVSQAGTVGFYLYRWDELAQEYVMVNEQLLPAVLEAAQGADYALLDGGADSAKTLRYALVEVESNGAERVYGPFDREVVNGSTEIGRGPQRQGVLSGVAGERAAGREATPRARSRRMDARLQRMQSAPQAGAKRSIGTSALRPAKRSAPRLKLTVAENGLYTVSARQIAEGLDLAAGRVQAAISGGRLSLSSQGNSIAWWTTELGDGIYFYGEGVGTPYSTENVYWLDLGGRAEGLETVWGGQPGAGFVATNFTDTEHFENDAFAVTVLAEGSVEDFYYWEYLAAGNAQYGTAQLALPVNNPAMLGGNATLTVHLHGATSTPAVEEHELRVAINGVEIGATVWDGAKAHDAAFTFSDTLLAAGGSTVTLTAVLRDGVPYSTILVDSLDLTYERRHQAVNGALEFSAGALPTVIIEGFGSSAVSILEIGDAAAPKWVDGVTVTATGSSFSAAFVPEADGRYFAVENAAMKLPAQRHRERSDLRNQSGADYVVIAPGALVGGANELAAYRGGSGLSTIAVDLEDIYDEFAYGLVTPQAIHEFLAYAWNNWPQQPKYAALAGAASFDYRDVQGIGGNLVPTNMVQTPHGLFASDIIYGDVQGSDSVPEIAVGRIPALTNEELSGYVAKLAAYEPLAAGGGVESLVMLADNAAPEGNFPLDSESLSRTRVPASVQVETIALGEQTKTEARTALFAAVAAGTEWVNFTGHGGIDRMADEGLVTTADLPQLAGGARLPVWTSLSCSIGRFEVPGWESLSEALVLSADGGAAAVWAPSGQSYHFDATVLNEALFDALYVDQAATVGDAVRQALAQFAIAGKMDYMARIYNLVGDPAYGVQ